MSLPDDEIAARWVLAVMDGYADPAGVPREGLGASASAAVDGYRLLFAARFDAAIECVRAVEQPSPYLRAVRFQVEALCRAEVMDGLGVDEYDVRTVAGAMQVFHTCEAAHVVGGIPLTIQLATEALAVGISEARARTWVRLALVRALLFQGEVERAGAELVIVTGEAESPLAIQAVRCLQAMVAGLRGKTSAVVAVAEEMRSHIESPTSYADSGLALLGAFGLASSGYPAAAAELLRFGAGGPGLPLLPPALRAYGYDLLVEAAADGGNLELAEWIMLEFDRLDLGANEQMVAAREAARARLRIGAGEMLAGVAAAEAAALRAAAARSELIGTRALLAAARVSTSPHDVRRILDLVDGVGSDELREWVRSSLAVDGRGPRPLPSVGWDRLSATQQVVARLAARGLRNQEIASLLVVSPRTVEVHVAAVLDALGVPNRVGIVAAARDTGTPDQTLLVALTPRQREVALHIAEGRSNADIAATLGVGVKAVEKHVTAVLRAVGVRSRAALAARLLASGE